MTEGSGEERSEVARVWSGKWIGMNICGVATGQRRPGRRREDAQAPPYAPHIWLDMRDIGQPGH